jgi:phage baseplate assembly protein W
MSTYSFKSVGRSAEEVFVEQLAAARQPFGPVTPLRIAGYGTDVFAMTYSIADMVHDNLRNLLLTNRGERLVLTEYGANLAPLAAEYVNIEDFNVAALERISHAVQTWMPYVDLDSYTSSIGAGAITITISYNVPMINVTAKKLQIVVRVT